MYYSVVVFKQSVGMSDHLALLMGGFLSITFFVGTLTSTLLIDRLGRRPLMMTGLAGSCMGMIITAVGVSYGTYKAGIAATFGIFWFQFIYGAGVQSAPWYVLLRTFKLNFSNKIKDLCGGDHSSQASSHCRCSRFCIWLDLDILCRPGHTTRH